ncbi:hypothetical protein J4E93_004182 [Alternaria ventricosa]|uniref:uncharacterized protein n=1 Tax=Alternaria ventricosa TaxID=1187951 RepID=UPI0020C3E613|nr:uncharacterized protein J4E93_004182 [Alternaria ventricosa]KAI4647772.1 hypothetical protein J4E93_004182 [Alternaria ventricosa]
MEPIYSRDECIAAIRDFYDFLGKMFMDVPSSIIYPPPSGWPNMTPEVADRLGKDPEIINLLRHLPFPDDQPCTARPHCLPGTRFHAWTKAVDELKEQEDAEREDLLIETESHEDQFGGIIPKYCIGLTYALNISEYVMLLDVRTGLVHWMDCPEEIIKACDPQPSRLVYPLEGEVKEEQDKSVVVVQEEEDDVEASDDNSENETPPTSDDGSDDGSDDENDGSVDFEDDDDDDDDSMDVEWGPCWPVRHFFAMLKNHYIKLNFIPHSNNRVVQIWTKRYTDHDRIPEGFAEFLQSIYHKHGWPNLEVYQKEACMAELEKATGTEGTKYYSLEQYFLNREY